MQFGRIRQFLLLGGGSLLADTAAWLRREGSIVEVVTSPRQTDEVLEDGSIFCSFLTEQDISFQVSERFNTDTNVHQLITQATLAISLGAPWIFKEETIGKFEGRLLNLHGTRLPQNRGGGGFSWRILQGNRLGFCQIHQVDSGIDTGPILKYEEFLYPSSCRIPRDFFSVDFRKHSRILRGFLQDVKQEVIFKPLQQQEYFSTYWPRLSTEHHGFIDWQSDVEHIERFICAFDEPYKGASTFVSGRRVFLKNCVVDYNEGNFHPFQNGIIYRKSAGYLYVAAGKGSLIIGLVNDEDGTDFHSRLRVGDRFHTPNSCLEQARNYRAIYTPKGLTIKR